MHQAPQAGAKLKSIIKIMITIVLVLLKTDHPVQLPLLGGCGIRRRAGQRTARRWIEKHKHIEPDISEIHCTESICKETLKLMLIMMGLKYRCWPANMSLSFQQSAGGLLSEWAVAC